MVQLDFDSSSSSPFPVAAFPYQVQAQDNQAEDSSSSAFQTRLEEKLSGAGQNEAGPTKVEAGKAKKRDRGEKLNQKERSFADKAESRGEKNPPGVEKNSSGANRVGKKPVLKTGPGLGGKEQKKEEPLKPGRLTPGQSVRKGVVVPEDPGILPAGFALPGETAAKGIETKRQRMGKHNLARQGGASVLAQRNSEKALKSLRIFDKQLLPEGKKQKPQTKGSENAPEQGKEQSGRIAKEKGEDPRIIIIDKRDARQPVPEASGEEKPVFKLPEANTHSEEAGGPELNFTKGLAAKTSFQPQPGAVQQEQIALLKELRKNSNSEIVKQACFLIKNDNGGEIRLTLKPEHLGNVKVRINLDNNHIAGKIIVENNTVREVFESNMSDLHRAFREGGFATATLDVSVGDDKSGKQQPRENSNRLLKVKGLEESMPLVLGWDQDNVLVDMMV